MSLGTPDERKGRPLPHILEWLTGKADLMRTIRMALKNLVSRPSRTLLTMFGIVLGVAVIIAVSITNETTMGFVERGFSRSLRQLGPDGDELDR